MHGAALEVGLWLVSAAAAGLCAALIASLHLSGRSKSEWLVAAGSGAAILITGSVLLLGSAGVLDIQSVAATHMVVLALVCGFAAASQVRRRHVAATTRRLLSVENLTVTDAALFSAFAAFFVTTARHIMQVHAPQADAFVYHLPLAANWATGGNLSIDALAPLREQIHYSANVELAWAWLLVGTRCPALVSAWGVMWSALGAVSLYRTARVCGCARALAVAPAFMFAGMHEVQRNIANGFVDEAFSAELLCVVMAVVLALRTGRLFWAALAGLLGGLMWGSKVSGLVYAGVCAAGFGIGVGYLLRRGLVTRLRGARLLLTFAAAVPLLGAYFTVRNMVQSGNVGYLSAGATRLRSTTIAAHWREYIGGHAQVTRELTALVAQAGGMTALAVLTIGVCALYLVGVSIYAARRPMGQARQAMILANVACLGALIMALYPFHPYSAMWHLDEPVVPGGLFRYTLGGAGLASLVFALAISRLPCRQLVGLLVVAGAITSVSLSDIPEGLFRTLLVAMPLGLVSASLARPLTKLLAVPTGYAVLAILPALSCVAGSRVSHKLDKASDGFYRALDGAGICAGDCISSWAYHASESLPPGSTIAWTGGPQGTFPYYGKGLQRRVVVISNCSPWGSRQYRAPDWGHLPPPNETVWLANVAAVRPDYVMLGMEAGGVVEMEWIAHRPDAFQLLMSGKAGALFRVIPDSLTGQGIKER